MAKHLYLAMVLHNHQPIGNFANVYEQNYNQAYEPIISLLEQHPSFQLTLHYTGSLLHWLKANRPELIERVRALVARGQVEILSGGFYEPILASIPDDDKIGQIKRLSAEVEDLFGYKPQGMWLAERVWEPTLPTPLSKTGLQYTIVDDTHFRYVGFEEQQAYGYYLTEDQGNRFHVFATPQMMRYNMLWKEVDEVIPLLHAQAAEHGPIAAMGDDGEKFGGWPGTFNRTYGDEQWMERFFQAVEQNSDWLKTTTLSNYFTNNAPLGRVYLPTASYSEMLEWSLPAKLSASLVQLGKELGDSDNPRDHLIRSFMRGGQWRNFLVKYPEINSKHKKMYYVHNKVAHLSGHVRAEAEDRLWEGQCNETYWHGVFGGIYLPHLRTAVYKSLIEAEKIADSSIRQGDWLEVEVFDFDYDGKPEIIVSGNAMNLYFDGQDGGSLFEWDFREREFNLANTLTRRPEAYHATLVETAIQMQAIASEGQLSRPLDVKFKEMGLEKLLHYDWYRRTSFLDHFLPPHATLENFYQCDYGEAGDFVNQPYEALLDHHNDDKKLEINFKRDGWVWQNDQPRPVRVEKNFALTAGATEFDVTYKVTNTGEQPIQTRFGFETNYGLNSGHADDSFYTVNGAKPQNAFLDSKVEDFAVTSLTLENGWFKLRVGLEFDTPATLWRIPIETVQRSEGGFERVYQCSCVMPVWSLNLESGASWQTTAKVKLTAL